MYYPCSENKDADQLRGYREADLRLCFRPCKFGFLTHRLKWYLSYYSRYILFEMLSKIVVKKLEIMFMAIAFQHARRMKMESNQEVT